MLDDSFRIRFKRIPFAVSYQTDKMGVTATHNHSEFEILHIIKGKCDITINNITYSASAGDMVFINPFEAHTIKPVGHELYSHKCVCFDCSLISDDDIADNIKDEHLRISNLVKSDYENIDFLIKAFDNSLMSHEKDGKYLRSEITSYLSLMFIHLAENGFADKISVNKENKSFCSRVLRYISEHYVENITSNDAARSLSYNQSYFCRTFRKNFNKQFSEYLAIYRVAASRSYLENSDMSISEVAYRCGFASQSYFSSCFKKRFGILPSEYKRGNMDNRRS